MPSGQCGIMSDDEDKLALVGEEPQRRLFINTCVFDLINEDDGAVTDTGEVSDHQALVCPPLKGLGFPLAVLAPV